MQQSCHTIRIKVPRRGGPGGKDFIIVATVGKDKMETVVRYAAEYMTHL